MPPNLKRVIDDRTSSERAASEEAEKIAQSQELASPGSVSHVGESSVSESVPHNRYIMPDNFQPVIGQFYIFVRDEQGTPRLTECFRNPTVVTPDTSGLSNVNFERQISRGPDHGIVQRHGGYQQLGGSPYRRALDNNVEFYPSGNLLHHAPEVNQMQTQQCRVDQQHALNHLNQLSSADDVSGHFHMQTQQHQIGLGQTLNQFNQLSLGGNASDRYRVQTQQQQIDQGHTFNQFQQLSLGENTSDGSRAQTQSHQINRQHALNQLNRPSLSGNDSGRSRFLTNPWENYPMAADNSFQAFPSGHSATPMAHTLGYRNNSPFNPSPSLHSAYAPSVISGPSGYASGPQIPSYGSFAPGAYASPNMGSSQFAYMTNSNVPNTPLSHVTNVRAHSNSPMPGSMGPASISSPNLAASSVPMVMNSEWTNRYGTPRQANVPVLKSLPYRSGSDAMFPQPAVAGMSVKLQQMQRGGRPDFPTVMSEQYLPFVENTRETRPDEWGVLKVSNVSEQER